MYFIESLIVGIIVVFVSKKLDENDRNEKKLAIEKKVSKFFNSFLGLFLLNILIASIALYIIKNLFVPMIDYIYKNTIITIIVTVILILINLFNYYIIRKEIVNNDEENEEKQENKKRCRNHLIVVSILCIIFVVLLLEIPGSVDIPPSSNVNSEKTQSELQNSSSQNEESKSITSKSSNTTSRASNNRVYAEFETSKYTYKGDVFPETQIPDGKGTAIYKNGDEYKGKWKNGEKHGKGVYTFADKRIFEGDFENDKRKPYGTHRNWPFNDKTRGRVVGTYTGHLINGKFHGEGKFEYESGEWFKGHFNNNEQWNGIFYEIDGSEYEIINGKGKY